MSKRLKYVESLFPNLYADGYSKHSHADIAYNCIAFAVGDLKRFWDGYGTCPGTFWPSTPGGSLAHLIEAFAAVGFKECDHGAPELGYEKVALYSNLTGWTHAARLRPDGWWESKLGRSVDILHKSPRGLEGDFYGTVFPFMKRTLKERLKWRLGLKAP